MHWNTVGILIKFVAFEDYSVFTLRTRWTFSGEVLV